MQARTGHLEHAFGRITRIAACVALAAILCGCAQTIETQLPDLKRPAADGMLQPADQKKAIEDMQRAKTEQQQQAIKTIEGSR